LWHVLCHHHSRTPCKCAVHFLGRAEVERISVRIWGGMDFRNICRRVEESVDAVRHVDECWDVI
jgi:hypothetical protein